MPLCRVYSTLRCSRSGKGASAEMSRSIASASNRGGSGSVRIVARPKLTSYHYSLE